MSAVQRFLDWRHELHIGRLGDACLLACTSGDKVTGRRLWVDLAQAIKARSPGQVARMEARMGIRVRRTIKQRVMDAFLRGLIPSRLVTATFRVFKLRSL